VSVSVAAYRKALKERTRERVSQPAANALMTLAMFARSRQRYRGPSDSPNRLDVAEEHRILFCARLVHTFQGGWARELNSEPLCATQVPRPTKTSFVSSCPDSSIVEYSARSIGGGPYATIYNCPFRRLALDAAHPCRRGDRIESCWCGAAGHRLRSASRQFRKLLSLRHL
jgi:hypothetical protein